MLAVTGRNSWLSRAAPQRGETTVSEKLQRSQCAEETSLPGRIYLPACPPSALNDVCSDFQPSVTCSTRARLHFQPPLHPAGLCVSAGPSPEINAMTRPAKMSAANTSCVHNMHRAEVWWVFKKLEGNTFAGHYKPFGSSLILLSIIWFKKFIIILFLLKFHLTIIAVTVIDSNGHLCDARPHDGNSDSRGCCHTVMYAAIKLNVFLWP